MRRLILLSFLVSTAAMAQVSGPWVTLPSAFAESESLSSIAEAGEVDAFTVPEFRVQRSHTRTKVVDPDRFDPEALAPEVTVDASTPYSQTATYQPGSTPVATNFEALGVGTPGYAITGAPPDTTLGVSPTQIVQWVNRHLAVYDKSGTPLLAPPGFIAGNQIWSAFPAGTLCRDFNQGDPLVQYDRLAGRWILSQFAFNGSFTANAQCIAVSTTSNALGTYSLYQYNFGNLLPDYGKLGVWPDAYYLTYNMFNVNGNSFDGGRACAYDRTAMLAGLPSPTQVCFNSTIHFSFLPADLDGTTLPPPGTPNFHISWDWYQTAPPYTMQLTKFAPDFVTPASSTFDDGFGGGPFSFVGFNLASNTLAPCNDLAAGTVCVPQLGTANLLDTLGDRHMYRLVYRNFGDHDALLVTQAVDNVAATTAQLRWWEIRNPNANPPVVHQNSTFAPNADARWMSSAAFDKLGNIGIGYSASSSAIHPGIRVAGRRKTDPKNLLRPEVVVQAGTGSQTGTLDRWGDYSTMQIDPADECMFWYTTQYIGTNGTFNWRTRVAAFKFPNCS